MADDAGVQCGAGLRLTGLAPGVSVGSFGGVCGEPRGIAIRRRSPTTAIPGGQRRRSCLELWGVRPPDLMPGGRARRAWSRTRRPRHAVHGKLRRVPGDAVRLLGRRSLRGAGQRQAARRGGRAHRLEIPAPACSSRHPTSPPRSPRSKDRSRHCRRSSQPPARATPLCSSVARRYGPSRAAPPTERGSFIRAGRPASPRERC